MRCTTWHHGALLAVLVLLGPRSIPLMGAHGEVVSDARAASDNLHVVHALHDIHGFDRGKAQPLTRPMATSLGSHHGADTTTLANADADADVNAAQHQPQLHAVHEQLAKGVRQSQSLQQAVLRLQTETNPRTGRAYWTGAQADVYVAAIDSSVSQHLCRTLGTHAKHMAAAGVNPVALLNAEVREAYSQQATEQLSHAASEHLATALQDNPAFANDAAAQALLGTGTLASTAANTASLTAPGVSLAQQLRLAVATAMIASLHAYAPITPKLATKMAMATTVAPPPASPPLTSTSSAHPDRHGVHLERRGVREFLSDLQSTLQEYVPLPSGWRNQQHSGSPAVMDDAVTTAPTSGAKIEEWFASMQFDPEPKLSSATTAADWLQEILNATPKDVSKPPLNDLAAYLVLSDYPGRAGTAELSLQKLESHFPPAKTLKSGLRQGLLTGFHGKVQLLAQHGMSVSTAKLELYDNIKTRISDFQSSLEPPGTGIIRAIGSYEKPTLAEAPWDFVITKGCEFIESHEFNFVAILENQGHWIKTPHNDVCDWLADLLFGLRDTGFVDYLSNGPGITEEFKNHLLTCRLDDFRNSVSTFFRGETLGDASFGITPSQSGLYDKMRNIISDRLPKQQEILTSREALYRDFKLHCENVQNGVWARPQSLPATTGPSTENVEMERPQKDAPRSESGLIERPSAAVGPDAGVVGNGHPTVEPATGLPKSHKSGNVRPVDGSGVMKSTHGTEASVPETPMPLDEPAVPPVKASPVVPKTSSIVSGPDADVVRTGHPTAEPATGLPKPHKSGNVRPVGAGDVMKSTFTTADSAAVARTTVSDLAEDKAIWSLKGICIVAGVALALVAIVLLCIHAHAAPSSTRRVHQHPQSVARDGHRLRRRNMW
ncbi:hypothetical protein CXG81DRAFT_17308 [Caulochytrium protostelioides]|uniref:Uncharacterized protein n=1 Tax=Caulochytrium protostelioides TaxID=1555241 RepID=A0A4P9XCI2_9FUNG|nr:hypothetical protein CXG81DRAFT_17308 [Caulochytrium protostelioides]|eukprot:RKP03148.1 hypothetical protein CXG81DRAFT_17308 [Caulochytrium protostelioides]